MADSKVSALPGAGGFLSTDEIPVNEGGVSKKVTGAQVLAYVAPSFATPADVAAARAFAIAMAAALG